MTDQWAYDRVRKIVDAQTKPGWHDEHTPSGVAHAFARYVSEHESAPVDPLLIEARKLLADYAPPEWSREEIEAGCCDEQPGAVQLLSALRRGVEIGKAGAA
jgi:hypothetical protein